MTAMTRQATGMTRQMIERKVRNENEYRTTYESRNDKVSYGGRGYEGMESDDDNQESNNVEVSIYLGQVLQEQL